MSSIELWRRLFGGVVVTTIVGCNALSSIDDFVVADCRVDGCADTGTDDAGDPTPTPPTDDGGSVDEDAHTDDAPAPAECPALPNEWTWVRLVGTDDACSSGAKRTLLDHPRSSSDTCACDCNAAPSNPCEPSGSNVKFTTGYTWNSGCSGTGNIQAAGCLKGGSWSTSIDKVGGSPIAPVNVPCPAVATRPPLVDDGHFEICAEITAPRSCGDDLCTLHDGVDQACPDGFPKRREVTGSEDVDDTRSCGTTCACQTGATACIQASVTFYTDDKCKEGERTAVFDGTCKPFDSTNLNVGSAQYHAKPDVEACHPVSPTTTLAGSVTSKKSLTLCCRGS